MYLPTSIAVEKHAHGTRTCVSAHGYACVRKALRRSDEVHSDDVCPGSRPRASSCIGPLSLCSLCHLGRLPLLPSLERRAEVLDLHLYVSVFGDDASLLDDQDLLMQGMEMKHSEFFAKRAQFHNVIQLNDPLFTSHVHLHYRLMYLKVTIQPCVCSSASSG